MVLLHLQGKSFVPLLIVVYPFVVWWPIEMGERKERGKGRKCVSVRGWSKRVDGLGLVKGLGERFSYTHTLLFDYLFVFYQLINVFISLWTQNSVPGSKWTTQNYLITFFLYSWDAVFLGQSSSLLNFTRGCFLKEHVALDRSSWSLKSVL